MALRRLVSPLSLLLALQEYLAFKNVKGYLAFKNVQGYLAFKNVQGYLAFKNAPPPLRTTLQGYLALKKAPPRDRHMGTFRENFP